MKNIFNIFLLLTLLILSSCSKFNLATRIGQDTQLTSADFQKLNGNYSNLKTDTIRRGETLYSNFKEGTFGVHKQFSTEIIAVNKKQLILKLKNNDMVIDSIEVKGMYKNGYFRTKRQFSTEGIAGPLLWVLVERFSYIGLTKDNNLVVLNSNRVGYLILIIAPVYANGNKQSNYEYAIIKKSL